MLYGIGLTDADMSKAQVGIASMGWEGNTCNMHLNDLAKIVKQGVQEAGLVGLIFHTIGVSDGISMGTEGMKSSLPSREIIADSIEAVMRAQWYDANISLPGCDKNMPGSVIAMGRLNRPSIMIYGGTIKAGHHNGKTLDIVSAFECYGQYIAGKVTEKELSDVLHYACPGQGACGGMYTANTMASAIESLGMSLPYSSSSPATSEEKIRECKNAGKAIFQTMTSGVLPSVMEILDKVTLKSIKENTDIDLPEAEAMILTETDGYTWEEVEAQMEVVLRILKENDPTSIKTAKDEKDRLNLWKARKSAYATLARASRSFVLDDVTVPISSSPELLVGIQEISRRYGIVVAAFGHAGDGNLHPQILYDEYDPKQVERMEKVEEEIFGLAISLKGTLSGEHGIGLSKANYMTLEHDPVEMALMKRIKRTLDPNNIMNPGKRALD